MLPFVFALLLQVPSPADSLCPALSPSGPTTHNAVAALLTRVREASLPDM